MQLLSISVDEGVSNLRVSHDLQQGALGAGALIRRLASWRGTAFPMARNPALFPLAFARKATHPRIS